MPTPVSRMGGGRGQGTVMQKEAVHVRLISFFIADTIGRVYTPRGKRVLFNYRRHYILYTPERRAQRRDSGPINFEAGRFVRGAAQRLIEGRKNGALPIKRQRARWRKRFESIKIQTISGPSLILNFLPLPVPRPRNLHFHRVLIESFN